MGSEDSSVVDVSIAYRVAEGAIERKQIYWKAFDWKNRKSINLEDDIISAGDSTWRLEIFEKSGNTRLGTLNGGQGWGNYDYQSFYCNKDVFKVTDWTFKEEPRQFEKGFNKIGLTLDNCRDEEGKRECNLKISEGIGLEWNPEFKSKVTLID